jgi:hypothetical protein
VEIFIELSQETSHSAIFEFWTLSEAAEQSLVGADNVGLTLSGEDD